MRLRNIFLFLLAFWMAVFAACEKPEQSPIYPIPTVTVEMGSERRFDLDVYKRTAGAKLQVGQHPDLETRFLPKTGSLWIRPRKTAARLIQLPLFVNGRSLSLLVRVRPMVAHTFTYTPEEPGSHVVVMGGFNDWSRTALPLSDDNNDGIFERTVYLKPERHEYKFVISGEEMIDPKNPVFISNNIGGWNSILDLSSRKESESGRFLKRSQKGGWLNFSFQPPVDGSLPVSPIVTFNNSVLHPDIVDLQPGGGVAVNIRGLNNGILRLTGLDQEERAIPENHTLLRNGEPLHPRNHPEDWHFSVLYSLMVDRFLDGNQANTRRSKDPNIHPLANFHGGDLTGILQKLKEGYFNDLNISSLWISPVQTQPEESFVEWIPPNRRFTGYHGYWPVAAREIDPRFGTGEEFMELVKIAHSRGIKVILDFVSNHVHQEHPYFHEHREWFGQVEMEDGKMNIRNWSEETRLTTWFDVFIPSYDFSGAPDAVDQVVNDALWWLTTYDLDGFRQDAVKHVPHRFWRQLTKAMNLQNSERPLYQIGETFGSDELILSYVNPGELSAQFNFAIYFNARGPFSSDEADFTHLSSVIQTNLETFQPVNLMGNIISSHDQVRFMAFADGQLSFSDNGTERAFQNPPGEVQNLISYSKLVNFHAFNLSLPGIPVLYYGEEIGMMGAGDPDNRRPMRFESELSPEEQSTRERISALNRLRREFPSLALGDYLPLHIEGSVMVYTKVYFDEVVMFAVNNGSTRQRVSLNLPFVFTAVKNLLDDEVFLVGKSGVELELEPYSHGFYTLVP